MGLLDVFLKGDAAKAMRFKPPAGDPDAKYKNEAAKLRADANYEAFAGGGALGRLVRLPSTPTWQELKAADEAKVKAKLADDKAAAEAARVEQERQELQKKITALELKKRRETFVRLNELGKQERELERQKEIRRSEKRVAKLQRKGKR